MADHRKHHAFADEHARPAWRSRSFWFLVKGTLTGAFLTLVWGGLVRVFFLHHATFSINSICHFFGRRRFPTPDRSTNVAWLSVHTLPGAKVSFGELECTAEVGLNL